MDKSSEGDIKAPNEHLINKEHTPNPVDSTYPTSVSRTEDHTENHADHHPEHHPHDHKHHHLHSSPYTIHKDEKMHYFDHKKELESDAPYHRLEDGVESDDDANFGNYSNERSDFIAKVYGIICAQLIVTSIIVLLCISSKGMSNFLVKSVWFFIFNMVGTVITQLMIFCVPSMSRKVPNNYICLFAFTFFESMVVATFCAMVNDKVIVFAAALLTCIVVGALTVYAFRTKHDFSVLASVIWMLVPVLLVTLLLMIVFHSRFLHILYCGIATFILGIILIIDTQMVAGERTFALNEDDYIIGALMIYVDIISIFLQLLSLLSEFNRD